MNEKQNSSVTTDFPYINDNEDMLIQRLLLEEAEQIPTIEKARSVVQRRAKTVREMRIEKDIQTYAEKLFEHMLHAMPVISGNIHDATILAFSFDENLNVDYDEQLSQFVDLYMFNYVSQKLCWKTDLEKAEMKKIVEKAKELLNNNVYL